MFKVLILLAVVSAIAAKSVPMAPVTVGPSTPEPIPSLFVRQTRAAEAPVEPKEAQSPEGTESADDMDKAETFGFGFHKHIYVSPSYGYGGYYPYSYGYGYGYPSYVYGGYGYPYYY